MALWQYKVALIPQEWLSAGGEVESLFGEEGFDTEQTWGTFDTEILENEIDKILPRGKAWTDAYILWGDYEGDDIQLWRENAKTIDLVIRFDLRKPNKELLNGALEIARGSNLAILDLANRRVLPAKTEAIVEAIRKSEASKFVEDPHAFLSKYKPGGGAT